MYTEVKKTAVVNESHLSHSVIDNKLNIDPLILRISMNVKTILISITGNYPHTSEVSNTFMRKCT